MRIAGSAASPVINRTQVRLADFGEQQDRIAAERVLDQVLADSFPASDPPPWTLGVSPRDTMFRAVAPPPAALAGRTINRDQVRPAATGPGASSALAGRRPAARWVWTLASAIGVALLTPFAIILVGLPIALAARAIIEAIAWVAGLG